MLYGNVCRLYFSNDDAMPDLYSLSVPHITRRRYFGSNNIKIINVTTINLLQAIRYIKTLQS